MAEQQNVLVRKPWLVSCLREWVQFTRQYILRQTAHFQLTSVTRNVNCLFYHLSSRGAIGPLSLRCRPVAATAANSNRTTVSHFFPAPCVIMQLKITSFGNFALKFFFREISPLFPNQIVCVNCFLLHFITCTHISQRCADRTCYDSLSKGGFINYQFHCIHSGQMCNLCSVSDINTNFSVNCVEL